MRRRQYLALLSTGLAGCAGTGGDDATPTGSPTSTGPTPTEPATPEPEPVARQPPLSPDAPPLTEADVEAMLDEPDCSAIADAPVVCSRPDSPAESDTPVHVRAEPSVTTLPAEVTVTLENRHDEERFVHSAEDWNLWKATDGGWRYVGPPVANADLDLLEAGDAHTWELTFGTDPESEVFDPDPDSVGGLGPGVYAVTNEGELRAEDEAADVEDPVTVAALFGLAGEHPVVEPPPAVRTPDGYRVEIEPEDEGAAVAETVFERVGTADYNLAFEQATQYPDSRAALPYLLAEDPPRRVVVEAPTVLTAVGFFLDDLGVERASLFDAAFRFEQTSPQERP